MGRDKANLPIDGMTWLDHTAQRLAEVCRRVVIADRHQTVHPSWPSVDDGPGRGPAAGILGAHRAFPEAELLVLACDLPAVPVALLRHLVAAAPVDAVDVVIPRTQRGVEPLCALYRRRALERLADQVAGGDYALRHLVADTAERMTPLRVHCIEEAVLTRWGMPEHLFSNLNTPQDIERFESPCDPPQPPAGSLAGQPNNG
jgi:molybdopterin-guanine dinucleotide biosynthesis protein A